MAEQQPFGAYAPSSALARIIRWTRAAPNNWLGRKKAFALRRHGLGLVNGPIDVESLGARFRLFPGDNVCEKRLLFTPQFFDPLERTLLAEEIARRSGEFVFLDIGANVGAYALFAAGLAGGEARILAIEPQPVIFDRLCQNIRQNPGSGVKAIACAVADRDGMVTLFLDTENRGETGIHYTSPRHRAGGSVSVPAKTLLTLCQDEGLARIDAIKVDVEGAEDLVLEPFFQNAPRGLLPKLIIVENGGHRWQVDMPALMASNGYRLRAETRLNLVYEMADAASR